MTQPIIEDNVLRTLDDYQRRIEALERLQNPDQLAGFSGQYPWYTLRPYLCGGWIDLSSSEPYRYADGPTGEDLYESAGFYDTGQMLIFTGSVYWDPDGWWTSAPYSETLRASPSYQGDPLRYKDAEQLVAVNNGLQTGDTGVPDDLGSLLPYSMGNTTYYHLLIDTYFSFYSLIFPLEVSEYSASATAWTNGAGWHIRPTEGRPGPYAYPASLPHQTYGMLLSLSALAGPGLYGALDLTGTAHTGVPIDSEVILNGAVLPHDSTFTHVPLGGEAPRAADAYKGVAYAGPGMGRL